MNLYKYFLLKNILLFTLFGFACNSLKAQQDMAIIEGGSYIPLYGNDTLAVKVASFKIDRFPVTAADYNSFTKNNEGWQKDKIKPLFADESYLKNWKNNMQIGENQNPNAPVNYVSWFAAKKYCECQGKRLPTLDEWEYVAMASETKKDARQDLSYTQKILSWYETAHTDTLSVGKSKPNFWGVYDLHGLVWEWTLDYNSVMLSGESRKDVDSDQNLFCGAASIGATDLMNYAAFMRYAFRGSIKARYSMKNLGFRCASDL